jgi:thymidylate kinase
VSRFVRKTPTGLALAQQIDACVRERVLVFGSPPPHGADLDLLARPAELSVIAHWLAGRGFVQRGLKWAQFAGDEAVSVDLVPASGWDLVAAEVEDLFREADPVDDYSSLVLPSAHHEILIAARRVARAGGPLDDRVRARVERALSRNPDAWRLAEQLASAWNVSAGMRLLRSLWRKPDGAPRLVRTSAQLELARSLALRPGGLRVIWRGLGWRRPVVVGFSGIDGAGKSAQACALQQTLNDLGVDATIVWPPGQNLLFQMPPALKARLRAGLERVGRPDSGLGSGCSTPCAPDASESAGSNLRGPGVIEPTFPDLPRLHPVVMHVLATIVALVQVLSFWRGYRLQRGAAGVVIFDRYVLDATVYVRHRWGHGRRLRWQCWLIRALARRPLRVYLLDVTPDVAYLRKRDFPLDNLRGRARLYHEHWKDLGARRLDGERCRAELSEEIARDVWTALG